MILPVFQNTKYRFLLSTLCLSVIFSSSYSPSLMASNNKLLGDNEEKKIERTHDTNNNMGIETIEGEPSYKTQETGHKSGPIVKVMQIQMGEIEVPDDAISASFFNLPFSDIRSGRCVSKQLQRILMSDDFCNYWGIHFSPSTPDAMGMTPQQFIRYWSTPSFRVLSSDRYPHVEIAQMSGDGSTFQVYARDREKDYKSTMLQWRISGVKEIALNNLDYLTTSFSTDGSTIEGYTADTLPPYTKTHVQWKNGEITYLPSLTDAGPYLKAIRERDKTLISLDYASLNKADLFPDHFGAWRYDNITEFPALSDEFDAHAVAVSADGLTIVGYAVDKVSQQVQGAIQWREGEFTRLESVYDGSPHPFNGGLPLINGISGDGSTVIGSQASLAAIWRSGAFCSPKELLENSGVDLDGYEPGGRVFAISTNGLQISGYADKLISTDRNPNPYTEHFTYIAILPSKYSQ
jgi:hypothetical protein